jgi:hypothetical protein
MLGPARALVVVAGAAGTLMALAARSGMLCHCDGEKEPCAECQGDRLTFLHLLPRFVPYFRIVEVIKKGGNEKVMKGWAS